MTADVLDAGMIGSTQGTVAGDRLVRAPFSLASRNIQLPIGGPLIAQIVLAEIGALVPILHDRLCRAHLTAVIARAGRPPHRARDWERADFLGYGKTFLRRPPATGALAWRSSVGFRSDPADSDTSLRVRLVLHPWKELPLRTPRAAVPDTTLTIRTANLFRT